MCIVQKSWPSLNLGVIPPGVRTAKNVALGYDVGKISAGCLVLCFSSYFYSMFGLFFYVSTLWIVGFCLFSLRIASRYGHFVFIVFILWTLLLFIVINWAIWSTDHKVVINLSWVELIFIFAVFLPQSTAAIPIFRFLKTNGRYVGILLLVSISALLPISAWLGVGLQLFIRIGR